MVSGVQRSSCSSNDLHREENKLGENIFRTQSIYNKNILPNGAKKRGRPFGSLSSKTKKLMLEKQQSLANLRLQAMHSHQDEFSGYRRLQKFQKLDGSYYN